MLQLEVLRQAAATRDGFVDYLQDRVSSLEADSKSERHEVGTGGEATEASQSAETTSFESAAHQKLQEAMGQPRSTVEQQLTQRLSVSASRRSPITSNGSDIHATTATADYNDHRRQISLGRMPGALRMSWEPEIPSVSPQASRTHSSSRQGGEFASLLRTASDAIKGLFEVRSKRLTLSYLSLILTSMTEHGRWKNGPWVRCRERTCEPERS